MEVYINDLASVLQQLSVDVSVLVSNTSAPRSYKFGKISVQTYQIPEQPNSKELNGLTPPRGIDEFISAVQLISPDIVHFHSLGRAINAYCIQAVKKMDFPVVLTFHRATNICIRSDFSRFGVEACDGLIDKKTCLACFMNSKGLPRILAKPVATVLSKAQPGLKALIPSINIANHRYDEIKRVNKTADVVIALSEFTHGALMVNGFNTSRLKFVPQGISATLNKSSTKQNRINDHSQEVKFGFWGRIHPEKGIDLLIDAMGKIRKSNCSLTIIAMKVPGLEAYYSELQEKSEDNHSIMWIEEVPHDKLWDYLNDIDMMVLPTTTNEMAPLSIQEAFALKIPVLGSDCPGIADMVKHGINGLLFKKGKISELLTKLEMIIDDPSIITMLSGNIEEARTFDDVAEEMIEIYNGLVEAS